MDFSIDRCAAIIDVWRRGVYQGEPKVEHVLGAVRHAVLKLNKLNAACGGALIETDQREDL